MFGWQSFWGLVLNSWTLWQYPHTMLGAVQTGCFAMAAISAFCLLSGANEEYGRTFVRIGVLVGVVASVLQLWPTGDGQGAMIARHQPVTLAAMEGLFHTGNGAPLAILTISVTTSRWGSARRMGIRPLILNHSSREDNPLRLVYRCRVVVR